MASYPADDGFGGLNFPEDNSVSYTGQAAGLDQALPTYHIPGCTRPWIAFNECFYCSGYMQQQLSPSPPTQYQQPIPIIQERAPTPSNKTYAQAAAQAPPTRNTTSAAVLAATRQLRPQHPPQTRVQSSVQRNTVRPVPQRFSPGQPSYAQALGQARNATVTRRQPINIRTTHNTHQQALADAQFQAQVQAQRLRAPTQGNQVYQGQTFQYGSFSTGQAHLAPPMYPAQPQRPMIPTQPMLQGQIGNLDTMMLRPEYTNNPRNVEDMVQGTQFGSHRRPMSTHTSGSSTPMTPASPGAMSVRSGSSQQSRRTGSALRDPSLPYHCPHQSCSHTFHKQEDLRRHIQRKHTPMEERPHRCSEPGCRWAFVNPKDLNRHIATQHTSENSTGRPTRFCCQKPGCDKSYSRADNLRRHVNNDHYVDSGLGTSPTMSRTTSQSSYQAQPYRSN